MPAVYSEVDLSSLAAHGEPYRLVVSIAIRRDGSDLAAVEPVWARYYVHSRGWHCAVYFPLVDAVIYLKVRLLEGSRSWVWLRRRRVLPRLRTLCKWAVEAVEKAAGPRGGCRKTAAVCFGSA